MIYPEMLNTQPKVVALDQAELAVAIVEAMFSVDRPAGESAGECLNGLEPEVRAGALKAALAAMDYMLNAMNAGGLRAELVAESNTQ